MKNIKILSAVIISFLLFSCGDTVEYDEEYENWFGYYSRYKGQTNHAYFNGYTDAETMAKKVVEGINMIKKIYSTSVNALIPPIFLDNNTNYMYEDNGTCLTNWGYRDYNSQPISSIPSPDNYTFECFINYHNYCLYDSTSTSHRQVVVHYDNQASRQRIYANYKAIDGSKKINYELEARDINIKIADGSQSDNMTIFGLVIKDALYSTDNITAEDPRTPKSVTLRLDMPKQEAQYRFDFYSDNGTLNFYHYQYGFVTVNISSFLTNTAPVDERTKITMLYRENRRCTFSQEEFGNSNWFNCDDYPDYPN